MSNWNRDFDRDFKRTSNFLSVWFVFCAVLALAVIGVGIWAVVQLVTWLTTK